MASLRDDPRTADAPGLSRLVNFAGGKVAGEFLAALNADERVERFIEDVGLSALPIIALTGRRLVLVNRSFRGVVSLTSIPRPMSVQVGGKPKAWKVTVNCNDGKRVTFQTSRSDDITCFQAPSYAPYPGLPHGTASSPPASSLRDAPSPGTEHIADALAHAGWQAAEQAAATHMRSVGFLDARVTAAGPDGGLDVVATDAAAQVKWRVGPTGTPDVQQLVGAAHYYKHRLFYATAYTSSAQTYAETAGVALFILTPTLDAQVANSHAQALNKASAVGTPLTPEAMEARQIEEIVQWCAAVVKAAQWETSALAERAEALTQASAGLAALDQLNNVRLGPMRRAAAIAEARRHAKRGARKLGLTLH